MAQKSIGIVGYGVVGQAVEWAHSHDKVIIHDPASYKSQPLTDFKNLDAVYICVPTPSLDDGSCDTAILESVLKNLYFTNLTASTVIISHTTAPPSVYKKLVTLYPNLVHVPEFVQERNASSDYQNQLWGIFGGNLPWAERARDINRAGRNLKYQDCFLVSIETAALYKYFSNSFLAMKVTVANEWKQLADRLEIDWNELVYIAGNDNRIGKSHLLTPGHDGKPGWGGSCFPKDIAAIIREASSQAVDLQLLTYIQNLNNEHRK